MNPRAAFFTLRVSGQVIVTTKPNVTEGELDRIRECVEALGLRTHLIRGVHRTVIGCIGDDARLAEAALLSLPGVEVLSHSVAVAQCTKFLRAHPRIEVIDVCDTAGAAPDVARGAHTGAAAIASRRAAQQYQLDVLVHGIENDWNNSTAFVLVAMDRR